MSGARKCEDCGDETPTLTIATLRTMKAQLMGSAVRPVRPGAFYIGWAWTPMRVVRVTDALIVCYLSTQRTGLKNAFEGD